MIAKILPFLFRPKPVSDDAPGDYAAANYRPIMVHRENLTNLAQFWITEAKEQRAIGNERRAREALAIAEAVNASCVLTIDFFSRWKLKK